MTNKAKTLSNARHELFAQAIAQGKPAPDAHVAAGYVRSRQNAHALLRRSDIQLRVNELLAARDKMAIIATQEAAKALAIDKQWVMQALLEDRQKARELDQMSSAIRAVELLGKELGMFIERSENVNLNHVATLEPVTADEWEAREAPVH